MCKDINIPIIKTNSYIISPFSQSLQEQKLIILCVSKINEMIKEGKISETVESSITFELSTNEVIDFLGSGSNDIYNQIRKTCKKLVNNVIYILKISTQMILNT